MDARFQPLFMIGAPLLSIVFGYMMCKVSRKKETEEVIEELLRLREYNHDLLRKLNKEKEVTLGIRNFLQENE